MLRALIRLKVYIQDRFDLLLKVSILAALIAICIQLFQANENLERIKYSIPSIYEPVDVKITGVGRGVEVPVEVQNRSVDVNVTNTYDFQVRDNQSLLGNA
jgi:hypothetical protein